MRQNYLSIVILFLVALFFFRPVLLDGKLPISADTIVGLYHPYRDFYVASYPNGVPFKNFLITDPVRQQYPYRFLAVQNIFRSLSFWNPYSMAGFPLVGALQSASFYPLNVVLYILPFSFGWSLLIFLQPVLASIFMYLYLSHLRLSRWASFFGAFVFAYSGFSVAWFTWGTIGHVGLWLPLALLSVDKVVIGKRNRPLILWSAVFILSLVSSFFAGHLQTFFYLFITVVFYFLARWIQFGRQSKVLLYFLFGLVVFTLVTFVQWWPTLQLIAESARDVDQADWQKEGWFIPWQHLIQFVVPDFFGNPTTLNYWGVWNYAELVGYSGLLPLLLTFFVLFFRHDKKTFFFGILFFLSLTFSLPTIFAFIPFFLQIPFLDTAQPTRLLFLTTFSIAVLSSLGFDFLLRKRRGILVVLLAFIFIFAMLWAFVLHGGSFAQVLLQNIVVAKRNLLYSSFLFVNVAVLLVMYIFSKNKKFRLGLVMLLLVVTVIDLLRFAEKFTPFSNPEYLYPITRTITFLQSNVGNHRIMSVDDRILPPNFSVMYKLQTIDGYDPLYLRRYGELIAASERNRSDIAPPFGFNRIITPQNFESKIIDLMGVKYVLSLSDLLSPKLKKVFQEGETRVYENKGVLPRAFFVKNISVVDSKLDAIKRIMDKDTDLQTTAVLDDENAKGLSINDPDGGKAEIVEYAENRVVIDVDNEQDGFLVLTDSYYPTWKAKTSESGSLDEVEVLIYRTDYNFRGVYVPSGTRTVEFYNTFYVMD